MIKCLFSGLEDGGTYQLRTTPFDCIEGFEKILSDFDKMYESYQNAQSLFSFSGNGKIVLTADTYTLGVDSELEEREEEDIRAFLKQNGISDLSIDIVFSMIEEEDYSVVKVVEKIAKPNQTIAIQMTDTMYGNSEFELNT